MGNIRREGLYFHLTYVSLSHVFREVLKYDMPSRLITTIILFVIAAVIYVPIRLLTHSASEIQQTKLSRRAKWLYRAWAVFIFPASLLLWIPLFFIL